MNSTAGERTNDPVNTIVSLVLSEHKPLHFTPLQRFAGLCSLLSAILKQSTSLRFPLLHQSVRTLYLPDHLAVLTCKSGAVLTVPNLDCHGSHQINGSFCLQPAVNHAWQEAFCTCVSPTANAQDAAMQFCAPPRACYASAVYHN